MRQAREDNHLISPGCDVRERILVSARRKPHQSRRSGKYFLGSRTCRHPDTSAPSNAQSWPREWKTPYTAQYRISAEARKKQ